MVLYYAGTKHQVILCMIHRNIYHNDDEAHLFFSNYNILEDQIVERIEETRLFDKVFFLDDLGAWSKTSGVNYSDKKSLYSSLRETEKLYEQYDIFSEAMYSDYYLASDHSPFSVCFFLNGIKYHYIEEAVGAYSRYNLWLEIIKNRHPLLYTYAIEFGLHGHNDLVIDRWIDFEEQDNDEYLNEENCIDFSIEKVREIIDKETKEKILYCFVDFTERINGANAALILTEYLSHGGYASWEEHREIYGKIIDFFCYGLKIYIKPHPNEFEGLYGNWYDNVNVLDRSLPADLIPLILDGNFEVGAGISTTSIPTMRQCFSKIYWYRSDDMRSYMLIKHMELYYVACALLKDFTFGKEVYGLGADCNQISHFFDFECVVNDVSTVKEIRKDTNKIVFVDNLSYSSCKDRYQIIQLLNEAKKEDVIVFIDSQKDALFFDNYKIEYLHDVVPVKIEIKKTTESQTKWIYFYTEDDYMKNKLITTEINKMLKNAGINIIANRSDENIRERILEGMLNATEERCNVLLKENSFLKKAK